MSRLFTTGTTDNLHFYLSRPTATLLQPNWTWLAWFKETSNGAYRGVLMMYDIAGGTTPVGIRLSGTSGLAYEWAGSSDEYDGAGPPIVVGEWTMGAVTIEAGVATIYTGTQTKPLSFTRNVKTHSVLTVNPLDSAVVGMDGFDSSRTFDGLIMDPAIYDTVLSRREIDQYRRRRSPLDIRRSNLLFYSSLPGGSGTIPAEVGLIKTVTGTSASRDHLPINFKPTRSRRDAATSPPPPPSVTLPQLRRGMPRSIGRGFRA